MKESLKILVADGQYLTRKGMVQAVQLLFPDSGLSELPAGGDLLSHIREKAPDLLVLDPDWLDFSPELDLPKIMLVAPGIKILLISGKFDPDQLTIAWESGIQSILLKDASELEFRQAMQACIDNQRYLAAELVDLVMRKQAGKKEGSITHPLTPAELEIVRLIGQGLTTKEIANQKHLSFHTIITHRRNIFKKLDINNSSELLMYAIRNGIIPTIDYSI